MTIQQSTGFCKQCNKQVMTTRPGVNHILHFLITIFTCGAWVLIWIGLCIKFGGWKCSSCGLPVIGTSNKKKLVLPILLLIFCIFFVVPFFKNMIEKNVISKKHLTNRVKSEKINTQKNNKDSQLHEFKKTTNNQKLKPKKKLKPILPVKLITQEDLKNKLYKYRDNYKNYYPSKYKRILKKNPSFFSDLINLKVNKYADERNKLIEKNKIFASSNIIIKTMITSIKTNWWMTQLSKYTNSISQL